MKKSNPNCIAIGYSSEYEWADAGCRTKYYFICEDNRYEAESRKGWGFKKNFIEKFMKNLRLISTVLNIFSFIFTFFRQMFTIYKISNFFLPEYTVHIIFKSKMI